MILAWVKFREFHRWALLDHKSAFVIRGSHDYTLFSQYETHSDPCTTTVLFSQYGGLDDLCMVIQFSQYESIYDFCMAASLTALRSQWSLQACNFLALPPQFCFTVRETRWSLHGYTVFTAWRHQRSLHGFSFHNTKVPVFLAWLYSSYSMIASAIFAWLQFSQHESVRDVCRILLLQCESLSDLCMTTIFTTWKCQWCLQDYCSYSVKVSAIFAWLLFLAYNIKKSPWFLHEIWNVKPT